MEKLLKGILFSLSPIGNLKMYALYWSSFYKPQLVFPWEAHNSFAWVPGLSLKSKWLFIISAWETTPLFEISSFPPSLGYIFIWHNYILEYGFPGKVFSLFRYDSITNPLQGCHHQSRWLDIGHIVWVSVCYGQGEILVYEMGKRTESTLWTRKPA